jgi:hypothetical protein
MAHVRPYKPVATEVGTAEVGATEVGTAEVGATEVRTAEVGATEVAAKTTNMAATEAAKVATTTEAAKVAAAEAATTKSGGSRHGRYDHCQEDNCCGTNSPVHDGNSQHALNTTF